MQTQTNSQTSHSLQIQTWLKTGIKPWVYCSMSFIWPRAHIRQNTARGHQLQENSPEEKVPGIPILIPNHGPLSFLFQILQNTLLIVWKVCTTICRLQWRSNWRLFHSICLGCTVLRSLISMWMIQGIMTLLLVLFKVCWAWSFCRFSGCWNCYLLPFIFFRCCCWRNVVMLIILLLVFFLPLVSCFVNGIVNLSWLLVNRVFV